MSSTSLSSCDSDSSNYCQYNSVLQDSYGRIIQPGPPIPFYNTMGQPLVYYAEVQPHFRARKEQQRRGNRNCFIKAFKWYTQERGAEKQRDSECACFATWLDQKYGEYLRQSEVNQMTYPLQPQCTTHQTPCTPCNTEQSHTIKRFPRMKSPWIKRRRPNENTADTSSKTLNATCEYILHPKDLTRPPSECYQTPATCTNKSNSTLLSTEGEGTKKSIKSQSMTTIGRGKITHNSIDIVMFQEGPTNREMDKSLHACNQMQSDCKVAEEIQQVPISQLSKNPCDQRSTITQEIVEEILQKVPMKSQSVDTRELCTVNQGCKLTLEIQQEPMNEQGSVMPCDKNCIAEQKCNILQATKAPTISQKIETSRNQIGNEHKYPTTTSSRLNLCQVPSKIQEIDHECQCPDEVIMPVEAEMQCECLRQTFVLTTTSDLVCNCHVIERNPFILGEIHPNQRSVQPSSKAKSPLPIAKQLQRTPKKIDVICQCPEEDLIKCDATSQYDRNDFDSYRDTACICAEQEKPRNTYNVQATDTRTVRRDLVSVRKVTRSSLTMVRSDGAQTSDHSISFEKDAGHEYLFFMKIVCADKLNDCDCD